MSARWFVSVSRSGSSVSNVFPGSSADEAVKAALARFVEVHPPHVYVDSSDVVFVQADCDGMVVRGRWSLESERPLCSVHGTPMVWQDSWGWPGWVCGLCMESTPEEGLS